VALRRRIAAVAATWLVTLGSLAGQAHAASRIDLGAAESFAVLGATTVTSTGTSAIDGDVGVSPGTAITGFGPGTVTNGGLHAGDGQASAAHTALATAYAVAEARSPAAPTDGVLGGDTLTAGVYSSGTLDLSGTLTLDAEGHPNAVFILKASTTLTTAAASQVVLTGGAQSCNVFWQVGSSATLGASSSFTGSILARTSITVGDKVTLLGRALALDAAVTLSDNDVSVAHCAARSNTAPTIAPFSATLTGTTQTVHAAVGAWSVTDPSATDTGYRVTVQASEPTVDGSTAAAGTGGALTLTPKPAVPLSGNPAITGPTSTAGAQSLGATATTIVTAAANAGQGIWNFPADSGAGGSLAISIPGDARAGAYSRTLTFTTAPPAE